MKPKSDFVKDLNIRDGIITYNDFDIDENIPFEDQWYMYKEDILQIRYGDRFILDVGWYPESNPEGHFAVRAILENDWMNPISKIECRTLSELKEAIEKTALFIATERKKSH